MAVPRASELAAEVKTALQARQPIILIHECDSASRYRFPLPFGRFFRLTPRELLELGIYSKIALKLHEGVHRHYGAHQVALQLKRELEGVCQQPKIKVLSHLREPRYEGDGVLVDPNCCTRPSPRTCVPAHFLHAPSRHPGGRAP